MKKKLLKKNMLLLAALSMPSVVSATLDCTLKSLKTFAVAGEKNVLYAYATNYGDESLENVDLRIDLPCNVSYEASSGNGSYDVATGLWHIDRLDVDTQVSLGIQVKHQEKTETIPLRSALYFNENEILEYREAIVASAENVLIDWQELVPQFRLEAPLAEQVVLSANGVSFSATNIGEGQIETTVASFGDIGGLLKVTLNEKAPHSLSDAWFADADRLDLVALFTPHDSADLHFDFDESSYAQGATNIAFTLYHADKTDAANAFIVWGETDTGKLVHPRTSASQESTLRKMGSAPSLYAYDQDKGSQEHFVDGQVSYFFSEPVRSIMIRYYNQAPSALGEQELYISNIYTSSSKEFNAHARGVESLTSSAQIMIEEQTRDIHFTEVVRSATELALDDRCIAGPWQSRFYVEDFTPDELCGGDLSDVTVDSVPSHGRVRISKKQKKINYYPLNNFVGDDMFVLKVVDDAGREGLCTVNVCIDNSLEEILTRSVPQLKEQPVALDELPKSFKIANTTETKVVGDTVVSEPVRLVLDAIDDNTLDLPVTRSTVELISKNVVVKDVEIPVETSLEVKVVAPDEQKIVFEQGVIVESAPVFKSPIVQRVEQKARLFEPTFRAEIEQSQVDKNADCRKRRSPLMREILKKYCIDAGCQVMDNRIA
jgi:hypothetical protein